MNNLVDNTFALQEEVILHQLLNFERQEDLIHLYLQMVEAKVQAQAAAAAAGNPPEGYHEHFEGEEFGDGDEECEKFYDCSEFVNDAVVPTDTEPEYWRDMLNLEEFHDAPENIQEILEVVLGEQRRIPEVDIKDLHQEMLEHNNC